MVAPDESRSTVREVIVNALCDGFGHDNIAAVDVTDTHTLVTVTGFDDPIQVGIDPEDVILPEWAEPLAAGIKLDVAAVLAAMTPNEGRTA